MKTLETLEQDAKQAREEAIKEVSQYVPNAIEVTDKLILAAVAMVTYQFALGMQEVSGDGRGEALPEVRQEERDSDGWIEWKGGDCPVGYHEYVSVKNRDGSICKKWQAGDLRWEYAGKNAMLNPVYDIIAYCIVK